MTATPSPNGANGRDGRGRFLPGNRGGPGNPHVVQVNQLRSALLRAVSPKDIRAVIRKLVKMATAGNIEAAKLLMDRCIGKVDVEQVGDGHQQTNIQINLDIGAEEDRIAIEQAKANMAKVAASIPPPTM